MKIHSYIFSLLACLVIALPGYSQVDRNETLIRSALHGLEYEIKAGFSIGGTAPLPLPVEIRSIDGYNPTLAISIGGEVTKWFAVQRRKNQRCLDRRSQNQSPHFRTDNSSNGYLQVEQPLEY